MEEYRKLKGTVNLDDLSDDELEIVNSAETAVKLYDVTLQRITEEYEEINQEDVPKELEKNINSSNMEVIKEADEEEEEEKNMFGSAVMLEEEKQEEEDKKLFGSAVILENEKEDIKEDKKADKKEDKKSDDDDDEEDDDDFEVVDSKNIYY